MGAEPDLTGQDRLDCSHAWLEWCVIRTNDAPLDHFVRRFFRRRCSACGLVEYRYRVVHL